MDTTSKRKKKDCYKKKVTMVHPRIEENNRQRRTEEQKRRKPTRSKSVHEETHQSKASRSSIKQVISHAHLTHVLAAVVHQLTRRWRLQHLGATGTRTIWR